MKQFANWLYLSGGREGQKNTIQEIGRGDWSFYFPDPFFFLEIEKDILIWYDSN